MAVCQSHSFKCGCSVREVTSIGVIPYQTIGLYRRGGKTPQNYREPPLNSSLRPCGTLRIICAALSNPRIRAFSRSSRKPV